MKVLKVMMVIAGLLLFLVFVGGTYIKLALPDVGDAPKMTIKSTPEMVARGKYLANHVTVCMDCHSTRDWSLFAGPMDKEHMGAGGEKFDQNMGFPGVFYAANITPAAIGKWTDGELFRAITSGVNKDGKALFPLMASHRFGQMDQEDIKAIITYIRTLKPITKVVPLSVPDFPVSILINTMPKKPSFSLKPSETDTISYGGYLVNAAGCVDCHSKMDKGSLVAGTEFGGGMEFGLPNGVVRSPNITFDQATGLGSWTKSQFIERFKIYADSAYQSPKVNDGMNTPMPWVMYAGMKANDLGAIYTYLKSLKPIKNEVVKFETATAKK